jgi:hypothetical protein
MKKKTCQNRHARRRAAARFGINMGPRFHEELVTAIQTGKASFVEKQSNRISVWDVDYEGKVARIVYDRIRKQIVTFLYDTFPDQKPSRLKPVESAEVKPEVRAYDWQKWLEGNPPSFAAVPVPVRSLPRTTIPTAVVEKRERLCKDLGISPEKQRHYIDLITSGRAKLYNRQAKDVAMYEIADGDEVYWVMYNTTWGYLTKAVPIKNQTLKLF